MRISALVEAPNHVCCRYRIAAFRSDWESAGYSLHFHPFPSTWWECFSIGRELTSADAVIVQRKLLPSWQLTLLRKRVKNLLFDYDDAIWMRDSYHRRGLISHRRLSRFRSMVHHADYLIAGNGYLAAQARQWKSPDRVFVIPTCVNADQYVPRSLPSERSDIQLVWIGSSSTLRGLEMTAPLLNRIAEAIPNVVLKVICDRFPRFERLSVMPCPWSETTEATELASADIGISWIPDDPWSRGKCGLKIVQYMAAGLPVIANPVGVHREMIIPGVTGFLPETPEDWIEAMRYLAANPDLRHHMGQAGRQWMESEYSTRSASQKWHRLLANLSLQNSKRA